MFISVPKIKWEVNMKLTTVISVLYWTWPLSIVTVISVLYWTLATVHCYCYISIILDIVHCPNLHIRYKEVGCSTAFRFICGLSSDLPVTWAMQWLMVGWMTMDNDWERRGSKLSGFVHGTGAILAFMEGIPVEIRPENFPVTSQKLYPLI